MSGDVEANPGPKRNSCQSQSFSICHWNLNSLIAHSFTKVSLLTAYLSVNKFDIVCLSETFLNSEILTDDENLQIPGYSIARVGHPSNIKRGGVCVYYKTSLPLKLLDIKYIQECINLELIIGDSLCCFIILYRSPSQTHDNFEKFMKNFELNLDEINKKNPFLTVTLGDFNATSQTWFKNNKTSYKGSKFDILTCNHGLHQLINEPTHLLDSSSSCIDLIFTSQPNLVMELLTGQY